MKMARLGEVVEVVEPLLELPWSGTRAETILAPRVGAVVMGDVRAKRGAVDKVEAAPLGSLLLI